MIDALARNVAAGVLLAGALRRMRSTVEPRAIGTFIGAVLLLCLSPAWLHAQLQHGTVRGMVSMPDGTLPDGIRVSLLDITGTPIGNATTTAGEFELHDVAPGTYSLFADAPPLRARVDRVVVDTALPVNVTLVLSAATSEQVTVRGQFDARHGMATRVTLSGDTIRRTPSRVRSRGIQDAIAATPGWSTEDNGLLHARGVDDGFLYVIDGVPVYERLDGLFGIAPDPAMTDSVSVLTGFIPAEFGFKSGGVIEIRSAAPAADKLSGTLETGFGSDGAGDFSTVIGTRVHRSAAVTMGLAGVTSSRFLDPVHPDNLHNDGRALSGGAQLHWALSADSILTAITGFGHSDFDVPHSEEQDEAGQDQRQRLRNYWHTVSWQRSWSAHAVSQVAGYYRTGSAALDGSAFDLPLMTNADRGLRRYGVLASVSHQRGNHLFKAGGEASGLALDEAFSFAVTDQDEAAEAGLSDAVVGYTLQRPFQFAETARPSLYSLYVQDSIRAADALTVDVGIRADWSRMLVSASQLSPRVAAAYQPPGIAATFRVSVARLFQPPQSENVLLASSVEARELSPFADESTGGGVLPPERQTAFEAGVNTALAGGVRVDASYWRRWIRDAADPNVFYGTTIIFPNAVARGRAAGVDVRVEMPRRGRFSGYVNYAHARVVQFGPITGGLFLEDEIIEIGPGDSFTPDHDQRHAAGAGMHYDDERRGLSIDVAARYESGTPLEVDEDELDELRLRPGAELVDFDRGRVKPRRVMDVSVRQRLVQRPRFAIDVRAALLNLTGTRWAFNFGNPFSGTHFGPGRTVQAGLSIELH